jgi:hypothetical protein
MKDTKAIGDRSLPVEIQAEGKLRNFQRNPFLRFAVCRPEHTSTTSTFRLGHKLSTQPTLHAPPRPLTIPLLSSRSNLSSTSKSNIILLAASLCNVLAVRVWNALSASCDEPRWLAHAASLTIRAYGVDLAERTGVPKNHRLILHLGVMAIGWALDRIFEVLNGTF